MLGISASDLKYRGKCNDENSWDCVGLYWAVPAKNAYIIKTSRYFRESKKKTHKKIKYIVFFKNCITGKFYCRVCMRYGRNDVKNACRNTVYMNRYINAVTTISVQNITFWLSLREFECNYEFEIGEQIKFSWNRFLQCFLKRKLSALKTFFINMYYLLV